MEETMNELLARINESLATLGSKTKWIRAPDPIGGPFGDLLRTMKLAIIDDILQVLENTVPFLIANLEGVFPILYQGQPLMEIAERILAYDPGIVLVDYNLGATDGAALTRTLKSRGFERYIIGFSSDSSTSPKFTAAGADGCVEKSVLEIDDTIRQIARIMMSFR